MAADPQTSPQRKWPRIALCVGCGTQIYDQYILRVSPDLEWHAACLKCADCHQFLDESCTCFVRDGKTYCKSDYLRLFGAKCANCSKSFSKSDLVMRARNKIYHIDCFRCIACSRQLTRGDEFALRDDGLFCKAHHEEFDKSGSIADTNKDINTPNGLSLSNGPNGPNSDINGNSISPNSGAHLQMAAEPLPMVRHREGRPSVKHSAEHKPTRVRTVLNEKQLHTLRTCYNANPRPDALMKEQLVEMTGLSPRVIRVWFQNKRCKDKKRSILMKQMQQQEKYSMVAYSDSEYTTDYSPDGRQLNLSSMRGVPLIATSPVRHESPIQVNPLEVQTYQPPWKALADYALQPDIDPNAPHFQHLVNQMHGYTDIPPNETSLSSLHGPPTGPCTPMSYLDADLHQPHSHLSSDLSSPCASD
ncbi:insulin gene enhancer protein isl-1-like isoform X2 [Oppia nitens]|uniref:insulin gene enhancer protein isl-1-like isoform X2 n=1 Tax=Oppia nitens TaxID=1686743 RepID=UPI0023DAC585|nr:insulin gene enhancer protein isl-1-like isoform X2 [Oppia nitens]